MTQPKETPRAVKQTQHLLEILDCAETASQFVYMFRQFLNSMVGNTEIGEKAVIKFYENEEEFTQLAYDIAGQTFMEMSFKKRKKLTALYYGGYGWQFHEALAEVNHIILEKVIAIFEASDVLNENSENSEYLH